MPIHQALRRTRDYRPLCGTLRELRLGQFSEEFGNVAKACRILGYHRDTIWEVHRAF